MRAVALLFIVAIGAFVPAGCSTTPGSNEAALRAMEPVNACGPGGTQDITQCSSSRR